MKRKICALFFIFFSFTVCVFARGKPEEEEIVKQNNEWILCVTNFDIKSLPESKLSVASVITKKIVERLNEISYRTRISPEYAYYEGYAWYKARSAAAKNLSAKLDERALLIFNGDAQWRYKRNLAKVETEIEKLNADYLEIEKDAPLIDREPVFKLTEGNVTSAYPEPPKNGSEYKFCKEQNADAFLKGTVIDFHGRYNVSIKLYVVYAKTFIYEDSIIFSPDDLESALDEITSKLLLTLSGSRHAAIDIKIEPKDALILINKSFASRGDTGIIERAPGKYEITASANEHESITVETELKAGEIAEININLLQYKYIDIDIPGTAAGAVVYQGALYVGEAPLTLRLPTNIMEYVDLENKDGLRGTGVFNTPDDTDSSYSLSIRNRKPPKKGQVEKARTLYYWAWGGVWITGIVAWITYQSYSSSNAALAGLTPDQLNAQPDWVEENYKKYETSQKAMIAMGVVSVFWVVTLVRYLYLANRGSTPNVKPSRNK